MTEIPLSAAPAAPSPPKRRGWLVLLGASVIALALFLGLAVAAMIAEQWPPKDGMTLFVQWIFVTAVVVPMALGILLMNRGEPGIFRRLSASAKAWPGAVRDAVRSPAALRETLLRLTRTSLAVGALTAGLSLVLMYAFRPAAAGIAFVTLTAYSIVDPILLIWRRSWWLGAILSIVVWLPVFGLLTEVADNLNHLRESMMVFLLPFMVFPGAIAVSGFVRLFLKISGRPPAATTPS